MFEIGKKVVCIKDEAGWRSKQKLLCKGQIYIIVSVHNNDIEVDDIKGGWDISRFRPLEDDFADNIILSIKEQIDSEELQIA